MRSPRLALTFCCGMLITLTSAATMAQEKNWAGLDTMNGIKIKDYSGFEKKWKLVTVRYRKDTGEMRFTYANPKAWEAIQKKVTDYPDGAVFAKAGFIVGDDPAFPSSSVPKGTRRFQFMVRDKKKYTETEGWGYALFDSHGLTLSEEPRLSAQACHACHRLVPDRGYVFSELLDFNPFSSSYQAMMGPVQSLMLFRDGTVADLPAKLKIHLPAETGKIRLLTGELQKKMFEGTLNEVRPALALETKRTGLPAALVSDDGRSFSLVFIAKNISLDCARKTAGTEMTYIVSYAVADPGNTQAMASEKQIIVNNFCWK